MKGWKTIIAAFVIGGLGALEQAHVIDVVGEEYDGLVMLGIAFLMGGLRWVTTGPVGGK